jgi:hypothetical protein
MWLAYGVHETRAETGCTILGIYWMAEAPGWKNVVAQHTESLIHRARKISDLALK